MRVAPQGHRTYPAFVHFLCCVTLLSIYIAIMSISALWYAFHNPFTIVSPEYRLLSISDELMVTQNEATPVHELILAFAGIIFTLVIGSFFCYHLYLISYVNLPCIPTWPAYSGFLSLPALIKPQLNISRPSYSYGTYLLCPVGDTRFLIPHWNRNYLLPSEGSSKTLTEPYASMTSAGEATGPRSLVGIAHLGGCFECGAAAHRT